MLNDGPVASIRDHDLLVRVDEPSEADAVVSVLPHLFLQGRTGVRLGSDLRDEVGGERDEAFEAFIGERFQPVARNPRSIGSASGSIRERESTAGVERFPGVPGIGPLQKLCEYATAAIGTAGSGWGHDDNGAVGVAFELEMFISATELEKL
jgi:hypothetical protein